MSDVNASAAISSGSTTVASPPPAGVGPAAPQGAGEKPRSLRGDAWRELRSNPIVIVSAVLIAIMVVMAAFPGLFTTKPVDEATLSLSRQAPSSKAWFGYDLQGYDVYTRTIYGARASIMVGILATLFTLVVGTVTGVIAGYFGGKLDTVVSRLTDVFFGIPFFLGAILVLSSFPSGPDTPQLVIILKVVMALTVLGWPGLTRLMRSSVIQVKQADFVQAARALGASPLRIIVKHVLPIAIAPMIVVSTINLGGFIGAEATLSFLGLGLQPPVVSWGIAINDASQYLRVSPHMLLFPSTFLIIAVLAFVMLGDAVRDALDPKLR
jgi:oligopeptide transport system permease protein